MLFSKNSQILLRNSEIFKTKKVFFSGNIKDCFPLYLSTYHTKIHCYKYSDYIRFKKMKNIKKINIYNSLLVSKSMISDCDTIIYYWPKNKFEAQFQLMNILCHSSKKIKIFIVGDNSSGINSVFFLFRSWIKCKKIDYARHSILILGYIQEVKEFILKNFLKTHYWKNFFIQSLPGVFGHKKIDEGSKLLVSTFSKDIHGKILDVGCGSGFLSIALLYYAEKVNLTLVDNDISALFSSKETFIYNQKKAQFILSDIYSNVLDKFDLIISNPPFHDDLNLNFSMIKKIIFDSVKYLNNKGELRFVTNACFSYDMFLKKTFKRYLILRQTNKYKVYQCFMN